MSDTTQRRLKYKKFFDKLRINHCAHNVITDYFELEIKEKIDLIMNQSEKMTMEDWKKIIKNQNTFIASHTVPVAIDNANCPQSLIEDIMFTTITPSILISCLKKEMTNTKVTFLLSSIPNTVLMSEVIKYKNKNLPLPFPENVINRCAFQQTKRYKGMFLEYVKNEEKLKNFLSTNTITETYASHIINNKNISDETKELVYLQYGFDIDLLNHDTPQFICCDIFNSTMDFLYNKTEDEKTGEAIKTLTTLLAEDLLTTPQLIDFIKYYEMTNDTEKSFFKNFYDKIIMESDKQEVLLSSGNDSKFSNPNYPINEINKEIDKILFKLKNGKLTNGMYKEQAKILSHHLLYKRIPPKEIMDKILDILQNNKSEKNSYVALSIICNPRIEKSVRVKVKTIHKNSTAQMCHKLMSVLQKEKYSNEEIDFIMSKITGIHKTYRKDGTYDMPKIYLNVSKTQNLETIFEKLSQQFPKEYKVLDNCLYSIKHDFATIRLYKEHEELFCSHKKYSLPQIAYGFTLNIENIEKMDENDIKSVYESISTRDLNQIKSIIASAVSQQGDTVLLYSVIDKYMKQYNIIDEIILNREREKSEMEQIKKLGNIER